MRRNPDSHKGENGKVAVIGGSRWIHGAPLLCASAVQASGVDLVYVCVPACHENVAKGTSLNFQVWSFAGDEPTGGDVERMLEILATMDSAVIGPGFARTPGALTALRRIVTAASCPLVLDASALQPWTLDAVAGKGAILTPHLGELERMGIAPRAIGARAKEAHAVILLKDRIMHVAGPDGRMQEIRGGNAGLTVGGTGDALAGLITGLLAQRMERIEACVLASRIVKRAAEKLFPTHGYAFTAADVIARISAILHDLSPPEE